MTQMTQSRGIPWAPDLRFLGHLGQQKTNDPNDPMTMATGASLQFKTVTQMTQMT
jgi:extradiol dioxygenase family protein